MLFKIDEKSDVNLINIYNFISNMTWFFSPTDTSDILSR